MILKSFRIKNFRSITDSKECYLSPGITILAGKNESGKTNVLDGLQKFNKGAEFKKNDRPLNSSSTEPIEISFRFSIKGKEIQDILKKYNIKIELKENYDLTIIKSDNASDNYEVSSEVSEIIKQNEEKSRKEAIKKTNAVIRKVYTILKKYVKEEDDFENTKLLMEDSDEEIKKKINLVYAIIERVKPSINKQEDVKKLNLLKKDISDKELGISPSVDIDKLEQEIIDILPPVVLFNSFENILPSEVPIGEIKNPEILNKKYKIVKDFAILSNLDIPGLSNENDKQSRKKIVNSASGIFSKTFGEYWKQDPVRIFVDCDGPTLEFFIQDVVLTDKGNEIDETPYKVEQRSKGLQWYLSFFLMLKAEGAEKGNIILIDEPGLYLHAKAQQDVLRLLEELSKENQIIFTTHSPYLIDPNKLSRIRLVIKDKSTKETLIQDNFNKGADADTLTPIITAIGLDLSRGLAINKRKNVVVEGVSDYYYMEGVLGYLGKKKGYTFPEDIAIIPCVGHTTVSLIVSLLTGWGLKDYVIVLDRKGTTKTFNKLKKDGVSEERIIFVGKTSADSIESLFSSEDTERYKINATEKSKTITSKLFFEKITSDKSVKLSEETIKNFREKLFDKIKENYNNGYDKE